MTISFGVKMRNHDTGQWVQLNIQELTGKTIEQLFAEFDGQEIVAEFLFDEEVFYFCGTEEWLERMQRKGKAVLFSQAVEVLRERNQGLLSRVIPGVEVINGVFEGAVLERVEIEAD